MNRDFLVECFGKFRVFHQGQYTTRFRSQKTGALFAYLSLYNDRQHSRDVLVDLFWPDAPKVQAGRLNLSVALTSLKKQFEPSYLPSGSLFLINRSHIGINSQVLITDVAQFEDYINQALSLDKSTSSPIDSRQKRTLLENAIGLYNPELLPGLYESWITPHQDRLRRRFSQAVLALIHLCEELGDWEGVLTNSYRAFDADASDEVIAEKLLRALLKMNRLSDAATVFQRHTAALDAVGAAPSNTVAALLAPVSSSKKITTALSSEPHPSPPAPAPTNLVSPPSPTTEPEIAGQTVEQSPSFWQKLPHPLTRFFGREEELARLTWLLDTPWLRLITVTGPGGVGKTRLVSAFVERCHQGEIHTGHGTLPGNIQAVVSVPVADIQHGKLLVPEILKALPQDQRGVIRDGSVSDLALRLAQQPTLLILDNFEQLVETGGATVLAEILAQVPTLKCIVTSRHRIPIDGEFELPVRPMDAPPLPDSQHYTYFLSHTAEDLQQVLAEYPALALFVDRARASRPDFQLTRKNIEAVAELVSRLDGIPLALELAAARSQVFAPQQMLGMLEQRFDLLVTGKRSSASRYRSLRASMEWSYNLLTEELRALFVRLSVFRGGWTVEAAQEVIGDPSVVEGLEQLCDASLVQSRETAEGTLRFYLLETLADFVREKFDEVGEFALRHARFFLRLAEEAEEIPNRPEQAVESNTAYLNRLESEVDNFRQALQWLNQAHNTDTGGDTEGLQRRLVRALRRYWRLSGRFSEGRYWLKKAIASIPGDASTADAGLLNSAGVLAMLQGDFAESRVYLERSYTLEKAGANPSRVAGTLNNLGIVSSHQGDLEAAHRYFNESIIIWEQLGEQPRIGTALANLGGILALLGQYQEADQYLNRSLVIAQQIGDVVGQGVRLRNLAEVAYQQANYHQAEQQALASLRLLADSIFPLEAAYSLLHLGLIRRSPAYVTTAIQYCQYRKALLPDFEREELARLQESGALPPQTETSSIAASPCSLTEAFTQALEEPIRYPTPV